MTEYGKYSATGNDHPEIQIQQGRSGVPKTPVEMDETSLLVNKPVSLLIVVIANDGEIDADGSLISVDEMYFFCR